MGRRKTEPGGKCRLGRKGNAALEVRCKDSQEVFRFLSSPMAESTENIRDKRQRKLYIRQKDHGTRFHGPFHIMGY